MAICLLAALQQLVGSIADSEVCFQVGEEGTVRSPYTTATGTLAECYAKCKDGTWSGCSGFSRYKSAAANDKNANCWWVSDAANLLPFDINHNEYAYRLTCHTPPSPPQRPTSPPESIAVLPVRVLQATIEVDVPQLTNRKAALGLFLAATLEDAELEPSLFCTSAAISWRCLNQTHDQVVSFPQPRWRGSYLIRVLPFGHCMATASSAAFMAGPPPSASAPQVKVLTSNSALVRTCAELRQRKCSDLTVQVTRGPGAHVNDTIALYPIDPSTPTTVSSTQWRLTGFTPNVADPLRVLGSAGGVVSVSMAAPIFRKAYVAVLLHGDPRVPDRIMAISDVVRLGEETYSSVTPAEPGYYDARMASVPAQNLLPIALGAWSEANVAMTYSTPSASLESIYPNASLESIYPGGYYFFAAWVEIRYVCVGC